MIAHAKEITHWVSAEVLACGSQKVGGHKTFFEQPLSKFHLLRVQMTEIRSDKLTKRLLRKGF